MTPDRIKSLREEKKLSQEQLAKELKIGRASISNYELGLRVPDADVLIKYAIFFDTSIDYIAGTSPFKRSINDDLNKKYNENILAKKIEKSSLITQKHCDEAISAIIEILKCNMRTEQDTPIIIVTHLLNQIKQFSQSIEGDYSFSIQNKWNAMDYLQFDDFFDDNFPRLLQSLINDMGGIARFYKSEIRKNCGYIEPGEGDPTIEGCEDEEKDGE